jgi:hypothetical protein
VRLGILADTGPGLPIVLVGDLRAVDRRLERIGRRASGVGDRPRTGPAGLVYERGRRRVGRAARGRRRPAFCGPGRNRRPPRSGVEVQVARSRQADDRYREVTDRRAAQDQRTGGLQVDPEASEPNEHEDRRGVRDDRDGRGDGRGGEWKALRMLKLTREEFDAWYDAVSGRIKGMLAHGKAERERGRERDPGAIKAESRVRETAMERARSGVSKRELERRARMGRKL